MYVCLAPISIRSLSDGRRLGLAWLHCGPSRSSRTIATRCLYTNLGTLFAIQDQLHHGGLMRVIGTERITYYECGNANKKWEEIH